MTPRVLCAGILVGDLFVPPLPRLPTAGELLVTDDFLMGAGGCAANVAVVLSKLGVGSRVVGKVGRDSFGDFVTSSLAALGVDVSFIGRSETMGTAKTVIIPVAGEDRRYLHTVGANADLTGQDFGSGAMAGVDVVYLGGYLVLPGLQPGGGGRTLRSGASSGRTNAARRGPPRRHASLNGRSAFDPAER